MGYSRVFLLATAILAVSVCCARAADVDARTSALDSVAALSKPVTLTMRAATLKEILSKIQAATGQKMWAARDIGEDKATIRAADRPAREVLRELARCFDLGWSEKQGSDGSYLYLWMDKRSLDNMAQRQYEDYLAITKQFDDQLQVTARLVSSGTEFKLEDQNTSGLVEDDVDKLWLRGLATQSADMGAAVLQYVKLTEAQRKDLLKGKHITVDGSEICSEATQKWPEAKSFDFWVDASVGGYLLKCRRLPDKADSGGLLANAVFDDTRYDKTITAANDVLAKDESLKKELPAEKAEQTFNVPSHMVVVGGWTKDGAVADPLTLMRYIPVPRPGEGTAATPATMSDGLLAIAEALDLPLVAQFVSEYNGHVVKGGKLSPAPSSAKKGADRLAELSLLHKFVVEQDGGFLLAKSMVWHRLRPREIPEAAIKKWQAEVTGLEEPTFDVAVQVGALGWSQLRGAINNQATWFGSTQLYPLAQCEYALKLYASLTPGQRHLIDTGGSVPGSTMNDAQRYIFMQGFEQREQPMYDQASDQHWVERASFSVQDGGFGTDLYAVSGMQGLGSMDISTELESAGKSVPPAAEANEEALFGTVVPVAAKKLLAALAVKYPEIKPNKIAFYTTRSMSFSFDIGDKNRQSSLDYSVRQQ